MTEAFAKTRETHESTDPFGAELAALSAEDLPSHSEAAAFARLWRTRQSWINRSIERISFPEPERMHRRLSLDIQVPWAALDAEYDHEVLNVAVPLLASDRTSDLVAIDARDSSGRLLPLRTPSETILIAAAAVRLMVAPSLQGPAMFQRLPSHDTERIGRSESGWPPEADELIRALARGQLLLVDLPRSTTLRDIIRIDWDEAIAPARRRTWLPGKVGVAIKAASVASPNRHISIDAPAGFEITELIFDPSEKPAAVLGGFEEAAHIEAAAIDGGGLFFSLRPTRRTALQLFAPPLAVLGLSIALIAASTLSSAQSAVSALLLVGVAAMGALVGRTGAVRSWLGWDTEALLVGATSFAASSALALEASQLALDVLLSITAAVSAVAGVAAVQFASTVESSRRSDAANNRLFVSHSAQPSFPPQPTDSEVKEAVEKLIESTLSIEPSDLAPGPEPLQTMAADLAAGKSYVEVARPTPPKLTGDLAEDVLRLTGIDPQDLSRHLKITATPLKDRWRDQELSQDDHEKLAALRAAVLVVAGGLDTAGIRQWLLGGSEPPLKLIADGNVQMLRQRLDRYTVSPAE